MKTRTIFSTVAIILITASLSLLSSCKEKCPESIFFDGRYATYPVIKDTTGGILVVDIPSEGTETTLGASTWYSESIVRANTTPPWNQDGDMYFVDSQGDSLFGSFVGTSWPLTENPFAGEGEYLIDSGTGAYEGATGEGTYEYIVSPTMVGDLVFKGVLTLPYSKEQSK